MSAKHDKHRLHPDFEWMRAQKLSFKHRPKLMGRRAMRKSAKTGSISYKAFVRSGFTRDQVRELLDSEIRLKFDTLTGKPIEREN